MSHKHAASNPARTVHTWPPGRRERWRTGSAIGSTEGPVRSDSAYDTLIGITRNAEAQLAARNDERKAGRRVRRPGSRCLTREGSTRANVSRVGWVTLASRLCDVSHVETTTRSFRPRGGFTVTEKTTCGFSTRSAGLLLGK